MSGQCSCSGGGGGTGGGTGGSTGAGGTGWGSDGDSYRTTTSFSAGDDDDDPYRQPPTEPPRRPAPSNTGSGSGNSRCGRPTVARRGSPTRRAEISPRIVGGVESAAHSWPWQASLQIRGQHVCGASLIDSRHIVTAAHCFQNSGSPSAYKVVLGLHDRSALGSSHRTVNVETITKHPEYNNPNQHSNDIAVLRLSTSVPFSSSISPICLPQNDAPAGKECVVSGWGETQGTGDNQNLQEVTVPIVSHTECNDRRHYRGAVDNTMLCAGIAGRDSCQGDSGGPLVCQRSDSTWELQGIVSWGIDCAAPNKPGIYSRVNALKDWINDQIGDS